MRSCATPDCGAWYLDPVPDEADLPLLYRRYYTHDNVRGTGDVLGAGFPRRARLAHLARAFGYTQTPASSYWPAHLLALVPGRREHLEMTLLELRAEWRGPLLDVGCGTGETLRLMRDLGWEAEGIDLDPRAVDVARAAGLNAQIGTLETISLAERHFAAVTSNHVLEHVPDPGRFLRRSLQLTRPGGRLALITPNAASLGHRLFAGRWRGLEPPRHLQLFTRASLERATREAGWEEVRVKSSARLAAVIVRETMRPETAGLATSHQAGAVVRLAAGAFQVVERALLPMDREAGEELFLMARAPGGSR
jgi:SAM-dependent methyltransferase